MEGDYDDRLRAFYQAGVLEEKVLVLQQIGSGSRDFCPTIKKGATAGTCRFSTLCKKLSTPGRKMCARRSQQYCCGFHEHSITPDTCLFSTSCKKPFTLAYVC